MTAILCPGDTRQGPNFPSRAYEFPAAIELIETEPTPPKGIVASDRSCISIGPGGQKCCVAFFPPLQAAKPLHSRTELNYFVYGLRTP